MVLGLVMGMFALFALLAIATVVWARAQVAGRSQAAPSAPPGTGERTRMIQLAARASGDESGRALLLLLHALADPAPDNPVTVDWVRREPHDGQGLGMLVKITWDGNEWRRIMPWEAFRDRLEATLAAEPALDSPLARKLLADLAHGPTSGPARRPHDPS